MSWLVLGWPVCRMCGQGYAPTPFDLTSLRREPSVEKHAVETSTDGPADELGAAVVAVRQRATTEANFGEALKQARDPVREKRPPSPRFPARGEVEAAVPMAAASGVHDPRLPGYGRKQTPEIAYQLAPSRCRYQGPRGHLSVVTFFCHSARLDARRSYATSGDGVPNDATIDDVIAIRADRRSGPDGAVNGVFSGPRVCPRTTGVTGPRRYRQPFSKTGSRLRCMP